MMHTFRLLLASLVLLLTGAAHAQTLYYIHPDHLGTPRLIADEAGTTVWRWDNREPFGLSAPNEDADGNGQPLTFNLRFPGQYYDRETGTFYNYFRDYDPQTGRYIESDPIGLDGGINTYGYVGGNPLSVIDPEGLAGKGNGGVGGSSGKGTNSPYKHCREVKGEPDKIECMQKSTGKWIKKQKPPDWDQYKRCGDDSDPAAPAGFEPDPLAPISPLPGPFGSQFPRDPLSGGAGPVDQNPRPPWWAPVVLPIILWALGQ